MTQETFTIRDLFQEMASMAVTKEIFADPARFNEEGEVDPIVALRKVCGGFWPAAFIMANHELLGVEPPRENGTDVIDPSVLDLSLGEEEFERMLMRFADGIGLTVGTPSPSSLTD